MTGPVSRMQTRPDGTFRVLQVTDFHDDKDADAAERTWADVRKYLEHFAPNLLAVTGDIWCGDELPEDEAAHLMRRDVERLESLDVPWAFCWGNHDYVGDLETSMRALALARHSKVPYGASLGNYRIEVARINDPLWDLFFLNSGAQGLGPHPTGWLVETSRRLREARGRIVPAMAYFHVPLKQYESAWHEGRCKGVRNEDVLYYEEDGSALERFKAAGNVRACFVGHSHVNDYACDCDGILLAYGRTTGHGGYGGGVLPRGAKLLTLHPDGRFDVDTVFPDGTRTPSPR